MIGLNYYPALCGALTVARDPPTGHLLGGGNWACVLSASGIIFSVLIRVNTLYQPNSLEFLMWTLVFYCVVRFVYQEDNRWLWLASIALALGFLNKYNIFFLMLGLLPALLITPQRKLFLNKNLYLALLLALILVLPNLLWQYEHDFPVFHHLTELSDRQLANVDRFDFLKSQLLFFTGSLLVIISAFFSFFLYVPFRKYVFIFWCYIIVISLYFILKAKDYYAIGLYPVLIAFGSVYMEHLLKKRWLNYLKPLFILSPLVKFLAVYQLVLPVLSPEKIIE
jgi:4-amino-4-deoxy-L-arabinose transferase-like glycosyltransferase